MLIGLWRVVRFISWLFLACFVPFLNSLVWFSGVAESTIMKLMVRLSQVNSFLLGLIILLNAYVILAPFAPEGWYWWQQHHGSESTRLALQLQKPSHTPPSLTHKVLANTVIIPSMLLDQPVLEGKNMYAVLAQGIWRWPAGSTPDKGGNTVLVGHRFTYTNPKGVFYFLNKVQIGDKIGLLWADKTYVYSVVRTETVSPREVSILSPTARPTVTLYTCTPLWAPKNRLVVIAELESIS